MTTDTAARGGIGGICEVGLISVSCVQYLHTETGTIASVTPHNTECVSGDAERVDAERDEGFAVARQPVLDATEAAMAALLLAARGGMNETVGCVDKDVRVSFHGDR